MKRFPLILIPALLIIIISCDQREISLVPGVSQPEITLNGKWKVCLSSFENIQNADPGASVWQELDVPGECMMQGIPVKHDQPFVCFRKLVIPPDYKGKIIKIRFEGVYSYAKVWVNGSFIRDHSGGFTAWECDITRAVEPGSEASLYVEITDRADEISYASGYAKHPIGGILRNVTLLALPEIYPELLSITTDFDENFSDALLKVEGSLNGMAENCSVELELYDKEGRMLRLRHRKVELTDKRFHITNLIKDPLKWEAEHPDLYRLRVLFSEKRKPVWRKDYFFGFREIEVKGNKLLINGRQVKLRGACRHDIHPLLGRIATPENDKKDVLLAKEANINFIRTSHYPPSEKFLELCDKYGIFVEDETAVCFVGSHRTADYYPGDTENSSDFTGRYISQLTEMVNNHRNHPSVIIWSIGNENVFGDNFRKSYEWVKSADPSRPVIYSYPGMVPDTVKAYDIISMHYPGTNGTMDQYGMKTSSFSHEGMPVLFDEWAHVACYNSKTLREDPNIRDFWGISLDSMWLNIFEAEGGLGGAIWGMTDETFMMPATLPGYNDWWGKLDKNVIPGTFTGPTVGYGEWGIIDTWRRKKPEFWSVKKAYSPIRVLQTTNFEFLPGKSVEIPVYNRFDFTNLNEVALKIRIDGSTQMISTPDLPPHSKGIVDFQIGKKPSDGRIYLEFTDKTGLLIDSYILREKRSPVKSNPVNITGNIGLVREGDRYVITCNNDLKITVDRYTGLFRTIETRSGQKIFAGPFLNMRIQGNQMPDSILYPVNPCTQWRLRSLSVTREENSVHLTVKGSFAGTVEALFLITVRPDGSIITDYRADNLPGGKIREAGIRYIFTSDFDSLSWKRNPYWSNYPEDHLSATEGNVALYTTENKSYRELPRKDWQFDKKSFFYDGIKDETSREIINVARSTKENITEYTLTNKYGEKISVPGNGDISCRIAKNGDNINLFISDLTGYPDLGWGNYCRNISPDKSHSGIISIALQ